MCVFVKREKQSIGKQKPNKKKIGNNAKIKGRINQIRQQRNIDINKKQKNIIIYIKKGHKKAEEKSKSVIEKDVNNMFLEYLSSEKSTHRNTKGRSA